jgi:hypothetical protein
MDLLTLSQNRKPAAEVLAGLTERDRNVSVAAGQGLIRRAKELNLNLPDYLRLAIKPEGMYAEAGLDGYETARAFLNLPTKDDYDQGIVLQAAADSFATFPGVRALFAPVIDDIVQWKYRQINLETVEPLISQSRVINGVEMITTVINDADADYQGYGMVAEGARIPVRSIKASDYNVKIYKFGSGIEWTYEFARRASLDLIAPYAQRMGVEVERGQVAAAYNMLKNGDPAHAAAPVRTQSAVATDWGLTTPPSGQINWEVLLAWLVERARAGVPIDTVVGNWDMWFQWNRMFTVPTVNAGVTNAELLSKGNVNLSQANPNFQFNVKFALATNATAGQLLGFSQADTLEELVENASDIEESEKYIENQKVKYFHTVNKGYRLIYGDTRSILNIAA